MSMYLLIVIIFPSRASDKCQREKRKTINGDDLVWAMSILGFEEYGEPLKLYLHKYREVCTALPEKAGCRARMSELAAATEAGVLS